MRFNHHWTPPLSTLLCHTALFSFSFVREKLRYLASSLPLSGVEIEGKVSGPPFSWPVIPDWTRCLQFGCRPAAVTVSSLKDNFPNVFYPTDDLSLWYHLRSPPATMRTSAGMMACSLWNGIAFRVRIPSVTDVSFFQKLALNSRHLEGLFFFLFFSWTCPRLVQLLPLCWNHLYSNPTELRGLKLSISAKDFCQLDSRETEWGFPAGLVFASISCPDSRADLSLHFRLTFFILKQFLNENILVWMLL